MAGRGTRATPERARALDMAGVIQAAPVIAFRAALVVLLVLAAAWFTYSIREVLVVAFLAVIIAAAIHAPVVALERRRVPRVGAVALVYLALIAVVGLLLGLVIPPLISQLRQLAADLPALLDEIALRARPLLEVFGQPTDGSGLIDLIVGQLGSIGGLLARIPLLAAGFVATLLMITFLSALMILERDRARGWSMRFVAPSDRPAWDDLLRKAAGRLGAYVRGQLLIMLVTGVGSYVGLTLIGVPFAVPLGIFAFVTEAIPLVGPIVAGLAMVAIAFTQGPVPAVLTLGLVILIQQLESLVLVPVIQGRLISISPVVALLAVLAGSSIGDIPGAILAIPVVAIAMVVIDDVVLPWRRLQIGEEPDRPPDEPAAASPPAKPKAKPVA
jgi:predicted PurR-regulated permease PerM